MLSTALLLATVTQSTPLVSVPPIGPSEVRHVMTLEGPSGAGRFGLFDARTTEFVVERLGPEFTQLTALEVLPFDVVGRSEITEALAHTPRVRYDVAGGSRVVLPGDGGTILKFTAQRGADAVYLFVLVPSSGLPSVLLERPAVNGDPFLPRISVDPDGAAILVATTVAAGGDLLEVELESGAVHDRTSNLPPLGYGVDGVFLARDFGFGVGNRGLVRFDRTPGAVAGRVPVVGAVPAYWRGDGAIDPSGECAAVVAGSGPDLLVPYLFGASGPARVASDTESPMLRVGYLPDVPHGPFLAVSPDGATAAWGIPTAGGIHGPTTEVVIGRVDAPSAAVVASGDLVIQDTLTDVGRVTPGPAGTILFAVGEDNDIAEGGLESADVFSMSLDVNGALDIRNLTRTGDSTFPFLGAVPTLTPTRFVQLTDTMALIHDDEEKRLLTLDLVTGAWGTVLSDVRDLTWVEVDPSTGAWVGEVRRDLDPNRPWQMVAASTPTSAVTIVDGGGAAVRFQVPSSHQGGATAAAAWIKVVGTSQFLDVFDFGAMQRTRWNTSAESFAPPLFFVGANTIAFTRSAGGLGVQQRLWSFRGAPRDDALNAPLRPATLLR